MKSTWFVLMAMFVTTACFAQKKGKIIIINKVNLDSTRYDDYKGDPYLFKENKPVDIYSIGGVSFEGILGNYNLLEQEFEIFQDGEYTLLPKQLYPKIVFKHKGKDKILLSNAHKDFDGEYVLVHFDEADTKLIEKFEGGSQINEINTPGKIERNKRISTRRKFYVLQDGELKKLELKEKKIVKLLKEKDAIKKFVKENNLDYEKLSDVIQIFQHLNEQNLL